MHSFPHQHRRWHSSAQDTSGQSYSPDPSSRGQKGLGSRLRLQRRCSISKVVRPLQIKDHSCMCRSMCTGGLPTTGNVRQLVESKCVGADAVQSGRAGLLIPQQKSEKHVHAGQRLACVGHLAQSSCPHTVSAVWEWTNDPLKSGPAKARPAGPVTPPLICTWCTVMFNLDPLKLIPVPAL